MIAFLLLALAAVAIVGFRRASPTARALVITGVASALGAITLLGALSFGLVVAPVFLVVALAAAALVWAGRPSRLAVATTALWCFGAALIVLALV